MKVPPTLVSMKGAAPSIERSTWLSAARCSTASGWKLCEDAVDRRAVADIDLEMRVAVAVARLGQRFEIAGVGQLVDVGDRPVGVADDVADHGRADEARAAGDQDFITWF